MSNIKKCFVSRWGNEGYIVEADFSQLEVIALAYLSQDDVLIDDILSGKDMHCINAEFLYKTPYATIKAAVDAKDPLWTARRKTAKAPGFLIQYGGGATTMAAKTGLPKEQCKGFIEGYYERYRGVKAFQEAVMTEVKSKRKPSMYTTAKGLPAGVGWYSSCTGRRYVFREYDVPDFLVQKGELTGFSPTQMKNYPVQGFATGDIVPLIVGELFDELFRNETLYKSALLINTVHDSILLDVHESVLDEACSLVKTTMENGPALIEKVFGFKFNLPLKAEVSYGRNWLEQKEWKV